LAPFFLSKYFIEDLINSGGYIINISSIHEKLSKRNFGLYAVSKSALSGLSRAMVLEWGNVLKIVTISPAAINTPMLHSGFVGEFSKIKNKINRSHPSGCMGSTTQISNLINFILSGNIDFINGSIIQMDGGISHKLYEIEN
jgi:NAD(P)-dependent dehydrogenase (short-subunit alcohol dehydrogenase family)